MSEHPTPDVRASRGALALALALGLLLAPQVPYAQGVQVGLTPPAPTVPPGAEFDLDLTVTQAGSPFNGFDVTVSYNPAALTLIPLSPSSLQQGCLMTGECGVACGSTFHRFSAAADSAAITDILLCNQIALVGPGQVYKLRFQASMTDQVTTVQIRRAAFYNAGLYVNPVTTANAQVTIGSTVGVGDASPAPRLALRAEPNPASGPVAFTLETDVAAVQRLEVHDLAGRLVRTVAHGWSAAGSRRVAWDGRDQAGLQVPSGVYLVTLGAGERSARIRVAMLR